MSELCLRIQRYANRAYRRAIALVPHPPYRDQGSLLEAYATKGVPRYITFDEADFASHVLGFVDQMRCGEFEYRYSPSAARPTLYSSVYACLTMALFGKLDQLDSAKKQAWADYLNGFQDPTDGLFKDACVANELFDDSDWWGARHLVLHAITAFARLGHLPKHPFRFLTPFKSSKTIDDWLGNIDWSSPSLGRTDVDNKIMNVVCALQYERDYRGDDASGRAVQHIFSSLLDVIDPSTGLWGCADTDNAYSLSRSVQFAYHLYLPMIYDNITIGSRNKLIDMAILTQNKLGGYGAQLNSSACEDIDSIDLLCKFSTETGYRSKDISLSLERSLPWQLANQNEDGGFVFRRNESLTYGHPMMSSAQNESAMFPTWFRSLSICYTMKRLHNSGYAIGKQPGLQYWLD